jgi:protein-tyrosine phosphatase
MNSGNSGSENSGNSKSLKSSKSNNNNNNNNNNNSYRTRKLKSLEFNKKNSNSNSKHTIKKIQNDNDPNDVYKLPNYKITTYTLDELKNIFDNKFLELTEEVGNLILSRYQAIDKLDIPVDLHKELNITSYIQSESKIPTYTAEQMREFLNIIPNPKTKIARKFTSSMRTGHLKLGSSSFVNRYYHQLVSVSGGAYNGEYQPDNTVTFEQFATYINKIYDEILKSLSEIFSRKGKYFDYKKNTEEIIKQIAFKIFKKESEIKTNKSVQRIIENSMEFIMDTLYINNNNTIFSLDSLSHEKIIELLVNVFYMSSLNSDVLPSYYCSKGGQKITEITGLNQVKCLFGMQKLSPLEEKVKNEMFETEEPIDQIKNRKIEKYNKKFKYLVILNHLRLKYNILHYVNLNIKNRKEKEMWEKYLPVQPKCVYYHFEIIDMCSFSIRDAIYILFTFIPLMMKNEKIIIHCAAGYGRTGSTILLLTICHTLITYIKEYATLKKLNKSNDSKLLEQQEKITKFITGLLCGGWELENLKTFLGLIYPSSKAIEEIFIRNNESNTSDILRSHRFNAIIIAILYYLEKMGYYQQCEPWISNIKTYLIYFTTAGFGIPWKKMEMKFSLEDIKAYISKITQKYILNLTFRLSPSIMPPLKNKNYSQIYDGTNLPIDYHDIGPNIVDQNIGIYIGESNA